MLTFFGESFGVFAKSITFASAFENERNLKQNESNYSAKGHGGVSSLK